MIITMRPGSMTVAAGTDTCASTLATATAVPGSRPVRRGLLGQPAGARAQRHDLARHLLGDDVASRGSSAAKKARLGKPSRLDQIAL